MIERRCRLSSCRRDFTVRYPSDPKQFCSPRCGGLATQGSPVDHGTKPRGRMANVLAFIEGLSPLEIFDTAVRLGYERSERERNGDDLGEIGRLTQGALT